jgi:hypothetical protein
MSALFSKPKNPLPTPLPPTIDKAREQLDVRKQLARRKGRAANLLAGADAPGATLGSAPATKILLGQ